MKGIVVKPTPGEDLHKYRVLRLWTEQVQMIEERVMESANQLRKAEPLDTLRGLCQPRQKKYPEPFRRRHVVFRFQRISDNNVHRSSLSVVRLYVLCFILFSQMAR